MTADELRAAARALRDRLLVDDWVDSRSPIAYGIALAAAFVATDSEAASLSCEAQKALRRAAHGALELAAKTGRLNVETSATCCVALDEPALVTEAVGTAAECRTAGFDPKLERPGLAAGASALAQVVRGSLHDLLDDDPPERDGEVFRALTWPLPMGEP